MTAVRSSNLAAIDYWGGTLTIAFHSGGVYEYRLNAPLAASAVLARDFDG